MSKPRLQIDVTTSEELTATLTAVFDTGSFDSIIREDRVPPGAVVVRRKTPKALRAAVGGSRLEIIGQIPLVLTIGDKRVEDAVLVAPKLAQEMLVGAKTMQAWDINVFTTNGDTKVEVGTDMRGPDVTEVD